MKKATKLIAGIALSAMLLTGCDILANRDYGSKVQPGSDGNDVQDVYMMYRTAGGTLTYEQWLESIRGPQGIQGEQGPQGEQGIQGEKGDEGEQGNSFLNGYGKPSDSKGKDGDTYLDFGSLILYSKENGHWVKQTGMTGDLRWDATTEAKMLAYFGEVLPYADLDSDYLDYIHIYGTSYSDSYEYFYIYDFNDFNVLGSYGSKLESFGFRYNKYSDSYRYTTANGKTIWAAFGFDDEYQMNVIQIEMPIFTGEITYYEDVQGYENITAFPAANLATTLNSAEQADYFKDIIKGNKWFEKYDFYQPSDKYSGYYRDMFAIEGDRTEELGEALVDAGFEETSTNYFTDSNGNVARLGQNGFVSYVNFFGDDIYLDYDEDYFLDEDFTKVDEFPTAFVNDNVPAEENRFSFNNDGDAWYTLAQHIEMGSDILDLATIATKGNFSNTAAAALESAGYEYDDEEEGFFVDDDHYAEVMFTRGYTIVNLYNWSQVDPRESATSKLASFYADTFNVNVSVPFSAFNEDAYFSFSAYGDDEMDIRVYYIEDEEVDTFAEALDTAGWTVEEDWYYTYICTDPVTGAVLNLDAWYLDYYGYLMIEAVWEEPSGGETPELPSVTPAEAYEALNAFYTAQGVDVGEIPVYAAADPEARFDISESTADAFIIDVYGATIAENDDYADALEAANWKVEDGQYDGEYIAKKGDAVLYIYDYTYLDGSIRLAFTVKLTAADVSEYVEEYFASYGIAASMPLYQAASNDVFYSVEEDFWYGDFYVYVEGTTAAEMNSFVELLKNNDWKLIATADGAYQLAYGDFGIVPYVIVYDMLEDDGYVMLDFYLGYAKITDNTVLSKGIEGFFNGYGLACTVPVYDVADPASYSRADDYQYVDEYTCLVTIYKTNEDEMDAYADKLAAAGWDVEYDHGTYYASYGDFGVIPGLIFELTDDSTVEIQCTLLFARMDSFDIIAFAMEYMFYANGFNVDVPLFESSNPNVYFYVNDLNYQYGVLDIYANNSGAADAAAYAEALTLAGWNVTLDDNTGVYTATSALEGPSAVIRFTAEDDEVAISCSIEYLVVTPTPFDVLARVSYMTGGDETDVEDLGDGWYGVQGGYYASSVSLDTLKGWVEEDFVLGDFVLYSTWTSVSYQGIPAQRAVFIDPNTDVVMVFYVFNDGPANYFVALSYYN